MQAELPPGIEVLVTYDQAGLIARSVSNVRDAVALGGLLTLVVVGLFLRSWRAMAGRRGRAPCHAADDFGALWLYRAGSMNLMSLGGLAVAIGLVVDDAVVVVEAVYRRVASGMERWAATAEALREIAWPVTNSTLTTVVVFAPLSLLSGVSGQFFAALAFTLSAAVLISLVVAVTLTPLLCGWLLVSLGTHARTPRGLYDRVLSRAARPAMANRGGRGGNPLLFAGIASGVGTGFLPELDEGAFVVDYFTPTGTSLARRTGWGGRSKRPSRRCRRWQSTSRRLGAELGPPAATRVLRGDITVALKPTRTRSGPEVIEEARTARGVRGSRASGWSSSSCSRTCSPIWRAIPIPSRSSFRARTSSALRSFAPQVAERLQDIPGLVDLYDGVAGCTPEIHLDVAPRLAPAGWGSPRERWRPRCAPPCWGRW